MKYRLVLTKKADRDLAKIDSRYRIKIMAALVALTDNPFLGKQLVGQWGDTWSYKVWPYRIIYQLIKQDLVIKIVRIGHRQGVYK